MHKLDKYCRRFTNDFVISNRSRYYNMGNHILRISDHIGNCSSGLFSIIKNNCYLLHHPNSGSIEIMNYEQIKGFVKIFALFPLGNMMQTQNWEMAKGEKSTIPVDELVIATNKRKYPLTWFDSNQRGTIAKLINTRLSKIGKPK